MSAAQSPKGSRASSPSSSSSSNSSSSSSSDSSCERVPLYKHVRPVRALKRFPAGSGAWLDNMYTVSQVGRSTAAHHDKQMEIWQANKDKYNEQRRRRRQEALEDLKNKGFPVYTDANGVHHMDVRVGRKCVPEAASVIPKSMIQPVGLNDVILLQEPEFLREVEDTVEIPEKREDMFDLQGFFGVKELVIVKNALKWGMFFHGKWDELASTTRLNYVGAARKACSNELVDYAKEFPALADKFFYYDPREDFWVRKLEDEELVEDVEAVAELAEEEVIVEVEKAEGAAAVGGGEAVVKIPASRKATIKKAAAAAGKKGARPFTRNPLRVVQFMVEANVDPWKLVLGTCETTQANSKASGLASCCYAYLRHMYALKEHKKNATQMSLFNRVLQWSFIFERYTKVARKQTQDRHAAQLTTPEKAAATVPWDKWQAAALSFLAHYFVVSGPKGDQVRIRTAAEGYKPYFALEQGREHRMRERKSITADSSVAKAYTPELLPWWKEDYNAVRKDAGTADRPNLRELRDCAMLACYSFLAPIRLDWATVVIKNEEEFKKLLAETEENAKVLDVDGLKFKGSAKKMNVLVVDNTENPTRVVACWFGKMKNIRSFGKPFVAKHLTQEDRGKPQLAVNVILAFLRERAALGYKSPCLFPYSTYKKDELTAEDNCFTNTAFGERVADLSHLLTGRNFTETLFRRSYITWFWKQPWNDPLKEDHWKRLLPSVHQNSKSANLGYIKDAYDERVERRVKEWQEQNKGKQMTHDLRIQFQREVVLEAEGMLEGAANFNPEVDNDDVLEKKRVEEEFKFDKEEVKQVHAEQKEQMDKIEEATGRRSARLAGKAPEEAAAAPPPPPQPKAPKAAAAPPPPPPPPPKQKAQRKAPAPPPPPPPPPPKALPKKKKVVAAAAPAAPAAPVIQNSRSGRQYVKRDWAGKA